MRYARQEDLQKLALMMQGSAEGICLADIQREFSVSRRTAERMRDALRNTYPQIEELGGDAGRKYWRFPPGSLGRRGTDEKVAREDILNIARRSKFDLCRRATTIGDGRIEGEARAESDGLRWN